MEQAGGAPARPGPKAAGRPARHRRPGAPPTARLATDGLPAGHQVRLDGEAMAGILAMLLVTTGSTSKPVAAYTLTLRPGDFAAAKVC